jgi:hypothetical protein
MLRRVHLPLMAELIMGDFFDLFHNAAIVSMIET